MGEIINCKPLADDIKYSIKEYINRLKDEYQRIPHLVVILVGDNPASKTYVSGKSKDCEEVGIKNTTLHFDSSITTHELVSKIEELNTNYNRLKLAKAYGWNEKSKREADARIAQLVRDIDKCLGLLNEID